MFFARIKLLKNRKREQFLCTLVVSVFPLPAGPAGAPPIDMCNA